MNMNRMSAMLLTLFAAAALGQTTSELTDPIEILKKTDAACKAVKLVKYDASTKVDEPRMKLSIAGNVILSRKTDSQPERYRVEGRFTDPETSVERHLVAGSDGETYYLIDHDRKKVYADIDPQVAGSAGEVLEGLVTRELVHPTPFTDEINGDKAELKGSAKVGDEDCYEVYVKYRGVPQEATWRFSKKDLLPRQRADVFPAGEQGGGGSSTKVLTNLVLNPTFVQDPFKLTIPEGYTKIDDFAP